MVGLGRSTIGCRHQPTVCRAQAADCSGSEIGASSVEYGLLIAGIAAVIAIAVFALGGPVKELFTDTCDELDAQASVTATC